MKKSLFNALCSVLAAAMLISVTGCGKKEKVVINSAADLNGKKIGCQAGTTGEIYIQENVSDADVKSFKTGIDASLALKNGSIDAIVLDEHLVIVNDKFATEEYAIAVRKGDSELLSSINSTISAMKSDGRYEALVNAFMPIDGSIVLPATIETSGNSTVKMGTNASFPPFEYTEGADPVGFDITMSQYIAKDYGAKLQVVDMNFDGLIAALQSGAIDFIAAGMTATDERRKNVDFSEPYFVSNQVIIIRK